MQRTSMYIACCGFITSEKCGSNLRSLRAETKRCRDSATVRNAARSHHWNVDCVYHLWDQCQRTVQTFFRGSKKRNAMAARFESRCNDRINTRLLECCRFIHRGRSTERQDAEFTTAIENACLGNTKHETENGWPRFEDSLHLFTERRSESIRPSRQWQAQLCEVRTQ